MAQCNHSIPDPSCEVCGLAPLARNHYFDGKWMASHQFQVEQNYVRGANKRQNAYMHGVGTVCGLKVTQHPQPDCRDRYVVLKEGLAIDCCGNEIVVPNDEVLDVATALAEELARQGIEPATLDTSDRQAYTVRILLKYHQVGAEPVPALLDNCDDGSGLECDQIVESYTWELALERETDTPDDGPLEPSLNWRQTLTVARPAAAVVDRDSERIYVAEMDAGGGVVRVYDSETHDLRAYARVHDAPGQTIRAVALSRNGERLYVACGPDDANGLAARVILINRSALEAGALPDPSAQPLPFIELAAGQTVVGLAAAMRDDALLALTANVADGLGARLERWSADALADYITALVSDPNAPAPPSVGRDLTALLREARTDPALAEIQPTDMVQDTDGRWLVVADSAGRLVALSLAGFNDAENSPVNFINAFGLGNGRVPRGIDLSYDGGYAYAVVSDGATPPLTSLLRLQTQPNDLSTYLPVAAPGSDRVRELPLTLPDVEGGQPDAIDVAVTPRDNFAYVLRRAADNSGGDVLIADIEEMEKLPPGLIPDADRAVWSQNARNRERLLAALRSGAIVQGVVDFQTLAPLGRRLYVATHREPPPEEAEEGEEPQAIYDGRIRVYEIDEASCDAGLRAIIEACATCGSIQPIVVATMRHYWLGRPMVEDEPLDTDEFNLIDNFSERPLAPSNVVLREVIECLIAKGIAEGIPGPRGPQGEAGPQGEQGDDGVGLPGPRGPGVVQVRTDPDIDQPFLDPIDNDPEGDFTLVLPEVGFEGPAANHVIGANFAHEEIFDRQRFEERFSSQTDERLNGFLIAFDKPVRAGSLNNRTAYAYILSARTFNVMNLPLLTLPVRVEPNAPQLDVQLLDGYRQRDGNADILLLEVSKEALVFEPDEPVNGVLLVWRELGASVGSIYDSIASMADPEPIPTQELDDFSEGHDFCLVTIVLRGNQIVDENGMVLDGNNMGRPNIAAPNMPSGNGTPGGDWVAVIHLDRRAIG